MPELQYLGHSAAAVRHGDVEIVIDPFLTGNPLAAARQEEFHPRAILVSHAHNDHIGDAVSIARRAGSTVVSCFEIATWFESQGCRAHGMHIGGTHAFDWGWLKLTPALHGSTFIDEHGAQHPLGLAAGLLLRMGDRILYHAGDTGLFGDMALVGRQGIDLALLPIGDNFTMGPDDALEAVRLLRPRRVVPIHYNTFPPIRQDAAAWCARVTAETGTPAVVVNPGDRLEY